VKIVSRLVRHLREINKNKMLKLKNLISLLSIVLMATLILPTSGCKKDEDPVRETSYDLKVQDVLGVTGTVTFIETTSSSATIAIKLAGAPSGSHPAALYMNTIAEGGELVQQLNPIDASGTSSTLITSLTYSQLITYNGFVRVVKSSNPNVILAQGDIGGNVITKTNKTYTLGTVGNFGVKGTALFEKRVNGSTLVTLSLTGTIAGEAYPATINLSSIETIGGGPVTKALSSVDGTTGKSYTTIRKLDSGLDITYDNWLVYNGYINIYQTAVDFDNIISQGNIGSSVK